MSQLPAVVRVIAEACRVNLAPAVRSTLAQVSPPFLTSAAARLAPLSRFGWYLSVSPLAVLLWCASSPDLFDHSDPWPPWCRRGPRRAGAQRRAARSPGHPAAIANYTALGSDRRNIVAMYDMILGTPSLGRPLSMRTLCSTKFSPACEGIVLL
jgi:hypothetical protein